jgi:dolichol-phosphate mannosyltransferase
VNTVSVIVPVFNNSKTLDELVERTVTTLNTVTSAFEILLIDDGSKDKSWHKIEILTQKYDSCRGVRLTRNFGQHRAIRAGLERSRGEIIILMDADLEDKPEELVKLIRTLNSDPSIQVVYTISEYDDGSRGRLSSQIFRRYFNRVTENALPAGVGTLRAFTQYIRKELLRYPERSAIYGPLMVEMGYRSVFVNVSRSSIGKGKSSYSVMKRLELGVSSLVLYSKRFYFSIVSFGLLVGLAAAIYLIAVTTNYLLGNRDLPAGQTLILFVALLGFSTLLILLGISFIYLSAIYREVLSRPYFHVESEIDAKLVINS